MRTLLLLRHAKSDWTDTGLEDHDRPLSTRGIRACPLIGEYVQKLNLVPDLVVSSSAVRCLDTARRTAAIWMPTPPVEEDRRLYLASAERILIRVRETLATVRTLMVVGHHPGVPELAWKLSQNPKSEKEKLLQEKYPTAALTVLRFEADDWGGIDSGKGLLEMFVEPKNFGQNRTVPVS